MQIEKSQVLPLPLHYLKFFFFCLIDKFNLMAISSVKQLLFSVKT
jgi:hypothetical protein